MGNLSKGENRVRTQFNPSQTDLVSDVKQKSAELINICEEMFPIDGSTVPAEKARCIALAQTAYEEAAMWAVKAATF